MSRDEVETGLHLLALLLFRNELKPDSADAILSLKEGQVSACRYSFSQRSLSQPCSQLLQGICLPACLPVCMLVCLLSVGLHVPMLGTHMSVCVT